MESGAKRADFNTNDSWAGAIDNLRIYDRALTPQEVQRLAAEAR